jgi:hypothetical protein
VPDGERTNGWFEYQRLVLSELERHDEGLRELQAGLSALVRQHDAILTKLDVIDKAQSARLASLETTQTEQSSRRWTALMALLTALLSVGIAVATYVAGRGG